MEDAPEDTKWVESIKGTVNGAVQEIENIRSLDHGIELLKSSDVEMSEFDVQVPDLWSELALITPWTGTLKYTKHLGGMVEIRLSVTGGVDHDTIGTLPQGYSPYDDVLCPVSDLSFGEFASVGIQTDGTIYCARQSHSELGGVINYISKDTTPVPLACWPKLIQTKFRDVAGVIVMKVTDASSTVTLPPQSVGNPAWEMIVSGGKRQVKITNLPGLPYNRKSKVRLLVIGGSNAG